jgi:hypothetical protein
MDLTGLSSIFDLGKTLIDKLIPDPAQKAAAQLNLLTLQQQGEFKQIDAQLEEMKTSMSAINTEGASADKWTSRARPGFLYVIYIVILFGLPLSILSIWFPSETMHVQQSFSAWVTGIPDSLMTLFGTGYLGYAAVRTYDKHIAAKVQIESMK